MKIKKLTPEQIADKTLGYKEYRKVLKPALQAMETKCNTPETATDFLIKTDYIFSDMVGKKMGLILIGKQSGGWLQCARNEIKADKKFTLTGKCYVKTNDEGLKTLVLLPAKGNAKKTLVDRQITKFALKGYPYTLQIGEAVEGVVNQEEEEETSSGVSDNTTTSDPQITEEQAERKRIMDARMKKMDEQIARLKAQFKIS